MLTVRENEWVVAYRDDGYVSILKATAASDLKMGKVRIRCDQLIGKEYGGVYEMVTDEVEEEDPETISKNQKRKEKHRRPIKFCTLVRVSEPLDVLELVDEDAVDRDNRDIFDNNAGNQALDAEKVTAMREGGVSGTEIMRSLVQSSATFKLKTSYSQEKYLKRLSCKHRARFTLCRTSARTVAEAYFEKSPPSLLNDRVRSLRWCDSLPQMLSYANVHASARILCLDGAGGLLTMSTVERLLDGVCLHVVTRKKDAESGYRCMQVDFLNLERGVAERRVVYVTIPELISGVANAPPAGLDHAEAEEHEASAIMDDDADGAEGRVEDDTEAGGAREEPAAAAGAPATAPPEHARKRAKTYESEEARKQSRANREAAKQAALDSVKGKGADGLLIASPHDCWDALEALLPHLGAGMPFAVHSPMLEPLMRCRARLVGRAMAVQVTESFCREIQVLPQRTHPLVSGSAAGGFILRGIKLA